MPNEQDGPASGHLRWTAEQTLGIETTGQSVLVSAAAGSGKTAVLAARCVHLVCDAEPRCDVDELLVVTFTEEAAAQMRSRITLALRERQQREPSERLAQQLALVDHAQISTLHAFCARLLRQHFQVAELDPAFTVMDADEASLLRIEVARQLFEERYDDDDGRFPSLVDHYGDGNDGELLKQLLHVHDLLTSVAEPEAWMKLSRRRIAGATEGRLEESVMGRELVLHLERGLQSLQQRCRKAIEAMTALRFPSYATVLREIQAILSSWSAALSAGGVDALAQVVASTQHPKLRPISNDVPNKERAKGMVDDLREELKKGSWREMLMFSAAQWQEGLRIMQPSAELFLGLVEQFSTRYAAAKRAAGVVDFADLERKTLDALTQPRGAASASAADVGQMRPSQRAPSDVARSYHRRFAHVLVDEFQDINEVQEAILALVSRECLAGMDAPHATDRSKNQASNLFCVGDVKQSIYRFRLAEAARFLERQKLFRKSVGHGKLIDLQANFRSRSPLLDSINAVFAGLMKADAVDIEYDQTHYLRGHAEYPPAVDERSFHGAPIELHIMPDEVDANASEDIAGEASSGEASAGEASAPAARGVTDESKPKRDEDDDLDRTEREARLVARRICALLGRHGSPAMQIHDVSAGPTRRRPIRPGDIVVLLRSMKFKANQYAAALRDHGIAVHADSREGFFAATEIRDMLALLELLDNQRQDLPLAAVMRSPLGRISAPEDSLAQLRIACGRAIGLHEAATRYAAEKSDLLASEINALFMRLSRWRREAARRPLADVIWMIYQESGYLAYVAGLASGTQRAQNLLHLHERAAQFAHFTSQGLSRFLEFLRQLSDEADMGQPSIAVEGRDVVRILSIHRSKGLEFPVVFLPDLGKQINLNDTCGHIVADRQAGLGMKVVDEKMQSRYPSLASTLVQERLVQQALAEELRVLYVAMTRAKEHLVLIGTATENELDKWQTRWRGHEGPLPRHAVLGAKSMLDWIGPMSVVAGRGVLEPVVHAPRAVRAWESPAALKTAMTAAQRAMGRLAPMPRAPTMTPTAQRVIERLGFVYPFTAFANMPAARSVTSLTHDGQGIPRRAQAAEHADALPVESEPPAIADSKGKLRRPRFLGETALSATDRGTATHLVLQHLNFAGGCDAADIDRQIQSLVTRRILTEAQSKGVDRAAIAWLLDDPVGRALRDHPAAVRRELPVNFAAPGDAIEPADSANSLDRVMIRGRIDVLVLRPESALLLDYKTDKVSTPQVAERAAGYRPQLLAYRDAIMRITGWRIDEVYLAFLSPRVMWRVVD